jgi:hypothetical protein
MGEKAKESNVTDTAEFFAVRRAANLDSQPDLWITDLPPEVNAPIPEDDATRAIRACMKYERISRDCREGSAEESEVEEARINMEAALSELNAMERKNVETLISGARKGFSTTEEEDPPPDLGFNPGA